MAFGAHRRRMQTNWLGVKVDILIPNALPDRFRHSVLAEATLTCANTRIF